VATSIANITWPFVPGSFGTKVEYKLTTDTTWTQPGAPSLTFQVLTGTGACCPATYTLSADGTYCFKTSTTTATPPSSSENTVAESFFTYSCWGTLVYNPGYGLNGVGPFLMIPTSNSFWINGPGYPAAGTTGAGPMNRAGLWAATTMDNQTVGFTVCVTVPVTTTYLVAIAGDNVPSISLDGNAIVNMDPNALGLYLAGNGFPAITPFASEAAFRFWNVYPVLITAGTHVLEMTCLNTTGPAAMAAEIYNATITDLIAAHSYTDLGAKLIFSTKDYIGQPVQIGSGGIGYTCPSGYSLVLCDGPPFCTNTISTPTISC
jgi:hypothetical protein